MRVRRSSKRRTCNVPGCGAHFWPRRRGPHIACEVVIPVPGRMEGAVYRRLHLDGSRTADIAVYDRKTRTWAMGQPLPARPRKAWQEAVRHARAWVADRDGNAGMELPSGNASRLLNVRARRTRTRARVSIDAG